MKLATTTEDFALYTDSQIKSLEYIAMSGFKYADYSFCIDGKKRDGVFADNWRDYIEKLKEKCMKLNVEFVQAHAPMGEPLAENNSQFIADNARCIEVCSMLGIKNLVVHSGYIGRLSKKETLLKNKEFYNKLLVTAEKYNVNILTENFNKMFIDDLYWIDNANDLLELIELVGHPLFHAVWDTGHANMQDMTQKDALKLLGKHVKALHVQDNNGFVDSHMCPLFGTLDVDSLMQGLLAIGYDGCFTFEAGNLFNQYNGRETVFEPSLETKLVAERLLFGIGTDILEKYKTGE